MKKRKLRSLGGQFLYYSFFFLFLFLMLIPHTYNQRNLLECKKKKKKKKEKINTITSWDLIKITIVWHLIILIIVYINHWFLFYSSFWISKNLLSSLCDIYAFIYSFFFFKYYYPWPSHPQPHPYHFYFVGQVKSHSEPNSTKQAFSLF